MLGTCNCCGQEEEELNTKDQCHECEQEEFEEYLRNIGYEG